MKPMAILLAGAMTLAACTASTPRPAPAEAAGDLTIGADSAVVLLDGWSRASLAGSTVAAEFTDGTSEQLEFRTVTTGDVAQLLTRNPDAVAEIVARTITADSTLMCDREHCATSQREIPLSEIAEPATSVNLGVVYQSWHAGGLWAAQIARTKTAGGYRLTIPGQSSISVRSDTPTPASTTTSAAVAPPTSLATSGGRPDVDNPASSPTAVVSPPAKPGGVTGTDLIGHNETADASNGDVISVGVAFGRLFQLKGLWRADRGAPFGERAAVVSAYAAPDRDAPAPPAPKFTDGLAAYQPAAAELTNSQLTAMSSPTTGCGIGVLCNIDGSGLQREVRAGGEADICTAAGSVKLHVLLSSETWTLSSPRQFYQFSAGGDPEQGLFYTASPPPLVTSKATQLTVDVVTVLESVNRVVAISGRTAVNEPMTLQRFLDSSSGVYRAC